MKSSKALANVFKALVSVSAATVIALFFFPFINADGFHLSGFQVAFGTTLEFSKSSAELYKSSYYILAFILTALTLVFSLVSYKKPGAKYASFGFSIATFINVCVLYFANPVTQYFDNRYTLKGIKKIPVKNISLENTFLVVFIVVCVLLVLATVSMLVSDYVEVKASNGAKVTIPRRIKRFFKDYKREIKNISWPTRSTVVKNFIVVIVMCVIVGAYIWLLDWGLGSLLKYLVGLKG